MMATQKEADQKSEKPANEKTGNLKKPLTFKEKLSDTKARMNKIVEGDDPGYHLR
jgi:hypothetical protein